MQFVQIDMFMAIPCQPYAPSFMYFAGIGPQPYNFVRDLNGHNIQPDPKLCPDYPREVGRGPVCQTIGTTPADMFFVLIGGIAYTHEYLFNHLLGHFVALVIYRGVLSAHVVALPINLSDREKALYAKQANKCTYP